MLRTLLLISVVIFICLPADVEGQDRNLNAKWGFYKQSHRIEITALGGYAWTSSRDAKLDETGGQLDIKNNPFFGIAIDAVLAEGSQLELLYNRQESDFVFTVPDGPGISTPVTVEYFHIGAIGGVQKGRVLPFSQLTLGATRFSNELIPDPDWKFSIMLGLGVKYYLGSFLAIRVQGRMPFTFMGSDSQFGCGPNGCFTTVGGLGIAQFDLSIGLALLL